MRPFLYSFLFRDAGAKRYVRRRRLIVFVFLWMFGLFGLLHMIGNPRLAMLHGADVVQLVASGVCFGVGFGLLFGNRKFPGE